MRISRNRLIASLLLAILSLPAAAEGIAGSDAIQTHTLDNGLKIIVWPDADIPNVAWYHWVRVGARNEYPGITGVSHFFEHMMFNGTSKREPGEFDRVMEANGGVNNAYTSSDLTVYTDWFPSTALEVIFDLESDRFANLAFVPAVVESERGVVQSERRSAIDNQNLWMLAEQTQAAAYIAHPYQFPVIGWASDIAGWKMEDLQRHFRTYYAPNNTTLVVVGAVRPEEIFRLAEQYFGPIPSQAQPEPIRTVEPEQQGQRRVEIRRQAQTPILEAAFHIPRANDPDTPALTLLLDILATGSSSRLYQRMVEQDQSVVSIDALTDGQFDPGTAWFLAVLPPQGDLSAVEATLFEELERVAKEGVTEAELDKVRNIQLADFWRKLATIDGKADLLGTFEVFHGDYRKTFEVPDRFEAVTTEQIQAVAARYFRATNSTVGTLIPTAEEPDGPDEASEGEDEA